MTALTIIGGGFVGSLLALALADAGIHVCIIDQTDIGNDSTIQDGRVSSIAFTSVQLLKALNIWPLIQAHAQGITEINVGEYQRPSLLSFGFNGGDIAPHIPFCMGYMIENTYLKKALWEQLRQQPAIQIISPAAIVHMDRQCKSVTLTLDTGEILETALVVGADGHNSAVRSLAGITFYERSYQQKALVTKIDLEKDHQGTAFEHFLPNGPFALLPLLNNQASLVWCDTPAVIEEAVQLENRTFTAALNRRFKNPQVGQLKATNHHRWAYDLSVKFSISPYTDRCVLIGDAAHFIHPVAGQGLNLGIRDVAVLAESLIEAVQLGLDVGSLSGLQRYHRQRIVDVSLMTAGTDSLIRLFSHDTPPVRFVCRLGTTIVNQLPAVKNIFRDYAMGLKKPLPTLLQGKKLL